jgi:hypothetical protein
MSTIKLLLFAAAGVATVMLLTSDKAKGMRDNIESKTKDNVTLWKKRLTSLSSNAGKTLSELRTLLSTEIEGLSADARRRIENVLNGAGDSVVRLKGNLSEQ